jgi:hypothetical protein
MENTNNDTTTVVDATNNLGVGSDQTAFTGTNNGASFKPNGGVRDVVSSQNPSGAYDFDGVDDNITLPSPINIKNRDWSICMSVNADSPFSKNFDMLVSGSTVGSIFGINDNGNGELVEFYTDSNNSSGFSVSTGLNQLVVVNDNSNRDTEWYSNGSQVATTSFNQYQNKTGSNTNFGSLDGTRQHFDGAIDDVRLYNRALSASEINQIYSNTQP